MNVPFIQISMRSLLDFLKRTTSTVVGTTLLLVTSSHNNVRESLLVEETLVGSAAWCHALLLLGDLGGLLADLSCLREGTVLLAHCS